MKKQYHIPTTRVVILDTEDTILAASGERADNAGMFAITPQRDYSTDLSGTTTTPWEDTPEIGSPW